MNQEEVETARESLVANLILLGGVALLFIGNSLAVAIAYRDYQKSLTATPQPIEAPPTLWYLRDFLVVKKRFLILK